MVVLRDYQQELLAQMKVALASPKSRVMLQLPTGGGKTRIAAALLDAWVKGGGKAAWLTHRKELSDQTCQVLNDIGVMATNSLTWHGGDPAPAMSHGTVILMVQTVSRRNRYEGVWDEYTSDDLLVIDEAHHAPAAGWERAINQWPGRVVGVTATPWRLDRYQGFRHLFSILILGPQIKEMQSGSWLARVEVRMPAAGELILGGQVDKGDYSESGIELANEGRDIWTAGALTFWQTHAEGRQTVVYAVSVRHAENLAAVFRNAGIPAGVLLGDTSAYQRGKLISQFKDGTLKVLVNVAVATEGLDLPDAACVVMTRPTLSLALCLQMIGRGLRPKFDGGNCLILDLAGNVERHGLPEDDRDWSLESRGRKDELGDSPVVRCPLCAGVSPAASRSCQACGSPFGKDCARCGDWRSWKRWSAETYCGEIHDLVCNLCHIDAHELDFLPEGLKEVLRKELAEDRPEVDSSSIDTLEAVQARITEVAENLVRARKIGDVASFNRMTGQLRSLLRREVHLKKAKLEEIKAEFASEIQPAVEEYISALNEKVLQGGRVTEIEVGFESERMRIRYYWETEDGEVCTSPWS